MKLNLVIFSKNRALQLDCLIRSIKDNFYIPCDSISVLYKSDNNYFNEGYLKLKKQNDLNWVAQQNFREDLLNIVNQYPADSFTMFLVDDNVIFKPFNGDILSHYTEEIGFISTRVDIKYKSPLPSFAYTTKYLLWDWSVGVAPWNYPFSLDGNIHNTLQIRDLLINTSFQAPNSLEGFGTTFLQKKHRFYPLALAPLEACTINIPINKVQTEYETAFPTTMEVEYLNAKYLEGFQIDNTPLYSIAPNDCHFPMPVTLKTDLQVL